jgi:hypothetical protein
MLKSLSGVLAGVHQLRRVDRILVACCGLAVCCLGLSWSTGAMATRPYAAGDRFGIQGVSGPTVVLWASSACQPCRDILPVIRAASEGRRIPLHVMSREPVSLIESMLNASGIEADSISSIPADQAVHLTKTPMVLSVGDDRRIRAVWTGKSQVLASEAALADLFQQPASTPANSTRKP